MAEKLEVFTYDNLALYDELLKGKMSSEDAKALKTVAIDGNTLKFYKVEEPVGDTAPAYTITLPETDISGLIPKITGAVAGNVVQAKADGTIEDSGIKAADLATKAEVKAVEDKADANTASIEAINNADTGILKTAKDYADGKVKDLSDGAVASNTAAIATLNGDESTAGSVKKQIKDAVDPINTKIGDTSALTTTEKGSVVGAINEVKGAVDSAKTAGEVTIDTSTTTEGYLKSYTIKQGGTEVGIINIPRDLFVVSGEIVVNPEGQPAGTYIKLVIANQEAPIYIDVKTLVDVYTAQASATQIQLAISATNEISATIVAGSVGTTELADGAITTVKLADGNVTKAKLHTDVQASLDKADSAVQSVVSGSANGTIAVDGTDVAVKGLGSAAYTAADAYDVAGAAAQALADAKTYADGLMEPISEDKIRALFA